MVQKRQWGRSIYKMLWRGNSEQSSTYFTKGFLLVMSIWCHHEWIQCFSRCEEMPGLGSWNQFLKISDYLKTCSPVSLEYSVPHSPRWTAFRACWGSTAAAQDSGSAEAGGKCSWQTPICSWHNPLQYSCQERSLVGYSPWDGKESDTTVQLRACVCTPTHTLQSKIHI